MFTGDFSISQITESTFDLQDTSDYASEPQNTFTGRRITLTTAYGTTLVPAGTTTSYIDFPFGGGDTISLDVLSKDYALTIKVEWFPITPVGGSTYNKTALYLFSQYNNEGYYGLIQDAAATPNIVNDTNWWTNLMKLRLSIDNAVQATTYTDIYNAQLNLDTGAYLLANSNLYF